MALIKTLILTAVLPESQALKQGLHLTKVAAPVPFWAREQIAIAQIGVRASRLALLENLPALGSIQGVLMAGLAGALSPDLRRGDVVIDSSVPLRQVPAGAHFGRIYGSDALIATPDDKRKLFAATSCLAVDMETQHARRFAHDRGVPFLSVRAVSDAAKDALDPTLLQLIDGHGNPRIAGAIAMLCRSPGKLPAMLRLQRASALALTNLAAAVREIITSGWPAPPSPPRQNE